MSLVRNLLADLVAKRLWPVALLLGLALVAAPVVLGGDASDEPVPIPAVDADPTGSAPLVAVAAEGDGRRISETGRNPFLKGDVEPSATDVLRRAFTAVAVAGADAGAQAAIDAGAAGGGGGGIDLPGGLGDPIVPLPGLDDVDVIPVGGGSGGGTTKPKTGSLDSYSVDLRIGRDGKLATRNDVARLSPLPRQDDPFFVYLGVAADGETAMFLVSSDATPTGDGKCKPSPANCERVLMKAGDTQFFDVTTPEGETIQYQLDVTRVSRQRSATADLAVAERSEESEVGREMLRRAVDSGAVKIADLAYSRDLGLVLQAGADPRKTTELFGGFRVDLRFGEPGALVKRYHLARLTPLPSVEEPSIVYLGVSGDGETVVFLNPTGAHESGDGRCVPSDEECHRILLGAGESSVLDVPTLDGRTTEYELRVDDVSALGAETPAEAEAMRRRESPQGRVILRRLIDEVAELAAGLSYSAESGTVVEE